MRTLFSKALLGHCQDPDFVFLTGDLGFMALEGVRDSAKDRFINAGVAEQNMVSVAAGLARSGLKPWVYSIAPFVYARPFEQIRNDVCLHGLPVFLVGNGGGYAYGVMGATHHALEDYGVLLGLSHMKVYVPAFGEDVAAAVERMLQQAGPAYVRLGRDEKPKDFPLPAYAPWRRVLVGQGATLLMVGPLAGGICAASMTLPESQRPCTWILSEMPFRPSDIPRDFLADIRRSKRLIVVEEHVAQGSAGAQLAHALAELGAVPERFCHRFALGYPSGYYGSQNYHRKECGLDVDSILELLKEGR
jgi:transketolase